MAYLQWKCTANIASALFLLFIQYAAPSGNSDDETFAAVKAAEQTETSFNWPKISWIFVFQYPIVEILCVAIQEATEATGHYCLNSLDPEFAHLWVELIESFSIGACVFVILQFRGHMKELMKMRRGLSKLAAFLQNHRLRPIYSAVGFQSIAPIPCYQDQLGLQLQRHPLRNPRRSYMC